MLRMSNSASLHVLSLFKIRCAVPSICSPHLSFPHPLLFVRKASNRKYVRRRWRVLRCAAATGAASAPGALRARSRALWRALRRRAGGAGKGHRGEPGVSKGRREGDQQRVVLPCRSVQDRRSVEIRSGRGSDAWLRPLLSGTARDRRREAVDIPRIEEAQFRVREAASGMLARLRGGGDPRSAARASGKDRRA